MIDPQHDFAMPYAHDELKYDRHSDIPQNLSRETLTFRNQPHTQEKALPMREMGSFKPGECVGGAGMHWGARARALPWDSTSKCAAARWSATALTTCRTTGPARTGA